MAREIAPLSRARTHINAGAPSSGSAGTGFGEVRTGDLLFDTTNQVLFKNEGSLASPYYVPVSYDDPKLFGVHSDFRDRVGKAIANTDAAAFIAGSGLRVFGQGVEVADSGLVVQAAGEGGHGLGRLITTNEASHTLAIGMAAGVMQPDQHQLLVIDAILTNVTDLLTRSMYLGFLGLAADALDPAVTGATTVATLIQDDMAGLFFDSNLTDADRLYAVWNKSNARATQDLTAEGETSVNIAAAGTEQRLRVEIAANGNATFFIDKLQVVQELIALDVDEECSPVLYIEAEGAAIEQIDVRTFAAYAYR